MDTYEKSEPRNWLIVAAAVLSVGTLFALVPAFHAYYDQAFHGAVSTRATTHPDTGEVEQARQEWAQALCETPGACRGTSIDDAIRGFAGRDRNSDPRVRPTAPEEMSYRALIGWNGNPNEAWQRVATAAEAAGAEGAVEGEPVEGEPVEGEPVEGEPVEGEPAAEEPAVEQPAAEAAPSEPAAEEAAPPQPRVRPVRPPVRPPAPVEPAEAAAPEAE